MSDPQTAYQLVSGFYGVEGHAWRWTARKFSVGLKPPPGAAGNGAKLRVDLYIPDVLIQQLGPMNLSASIDGRSLDAEKFTEPGLHQYRRDIPAAWLDSNIIPVNFSLDKSAPPVGVMGRELGIVVSAIGLIPK